MSRQLRKVETRPAPIQGKVIPDEIATLFGPASLIPGEELQTYDQTLRSVTLTIAPRDAIEWLWVRDIVDLIWETNRLRRCRDAVVANRRERALSQLLEDRGEPQGSFSREVRQQLVRDWSRGKPKAQARVATLLRTYGLTIDAVISQALFDRLEEVDKIDRLITRADERRDAVLREIERRRASLARLASAEVIDAEFVESASSASTSATAR